MAGRDPQPLDLAHLTDEELVVLQDGIDGVLVVVVKAGAYKESVSIQRRMGRLVSSAWKQSVDVALTAAFGSPNTGPPYRSKTKVERFLRRIGTALRTPLTKEQIKILGRQLTSIWKIAKRIGAKEVKIPFNFALRDRRAIAAINRQQVFWVGKFHDSHLSKRIAAVTDDVIFRQGFSPAEAAKVLRKTLEREYGLARITGPSRFAPEVPARYAGRPDQYWRLVTSNAAHQSRTFGKLTSFDEAEVRVYRLENPLDERTGRICREMHGQTFSVKAGMDKMNEILGAQDPEDVKRVAPWLSPSKIQQAIGGHPRGSPGATAGLEQANVILPPFHGECRTDVVMVG